MLTASLNCLPALNAGALLAGTSIGSFVLGLMLVLLALVGDIEKAGYSCKQGTASLTDNGSNHFEFSQNGKHRFVIRNHKPKWYKERINEILYADFEELCK